MNMCIHIFLRLPQNAVAMLYMCIYLYIYICTWMYMYILIYKYTVC